VDCGLYAWWDRHHQAGKQNYTGAELLTYKRTTFTNSAADWCNIWTNCGFDETSMKFGT